MSITPSLPAISHELSSAREHLRQGRLQDAELSYRRVLIANPDLSEALRFLANAALARGDPAEAVALLNRAIDINRDDPGMLLELGAAYRAGERLDAARYVLERALVLSNGRHPAARLLLANVLELDQRPELALLHYFRAIIEAQGAGQWIDDNSTEPGLRLLVRHAMKYVAQERRALFENELLPLQQSIPAAQLGRIDRTLAIYLRERDERPDDPLQRPGFLFVPGLGAERFIDNTQLSWLDDCTDIIAGLGSEIDACLVGSPASGIPSFSLNSLLEPHALSGNSPDQVSRISIYRCGLLNDQTRLNAPRLIAIMDTVPLVHIPKHGPDAEIIALNADTRLPLRHGRTNSRPTVIVAPEDSGDLQIVVGGECRSLQAGCAMVFDSTFGYELVNNSACMARAVTFEIWHPALTPVEQRAIAVLTSAVVEFDTQLQELA